MRRLKSDLTSITNTYISQLHFLISCANETNDIASLDESFKKILEQTTNFQNALKREREKAK